MAIRLLDDGVRIERIRQLIAPDGARTTEDDAVRLATVSPGGAGRGGRRARLEAEDLRHIPETSAHVGSEVVILRG